MTELRIDGRTVMLRASADLSECAMTSRTDPLGRIEIDGASRSTSKRTLVFGSEASSAAILVGRRGRLLTGRGGRAAAERRASREGEDADRH